MSGESLSTNTAPTPPRGPWPGQCVAAARPRPRRAPRGAVPVAVAVVAGPGGGRRQSGLGHGARSCSGLPGAFRALRHAGHPRRAGARAVALGGGGAAAVALHHVQAAGPRAARGECGSGPGPGSGRWRRWGRGDLPRGFVAPPVGCPEPGGHPQAPPACSRGHRSRRWLCLVLGPGIKRVLWYLGLCCSVLCCSILLYPVIFCSVLQ